MSDFETYQLNFAVAIDNLPDEISRKFVTYTGNDLPEMIKLRVQSGENANGGGFKPYAAKTVAIRKAKGMQTGHKDFTFTGEMWRKFGKKSFSTTGTKMATTIGGKNSDAEMKINDNSERENINIIAPSDEELQFIENELAKDIEEYIKRI
jgi:hypothetical protein